MNVLAKHAGGSANWGTNGRYLMTSSLMLLEGGSMPAIKSWLTACGKLLCTCSLASEPPWPHKEKSH
eukprot:2260809-Amphidinium_carterae.1